LASNDSLQSLHGLHNIASITSAVEFNNNPQLSDITALSRARGLDYAIWINNNPSLVNLDGIDSICSGPFYDLIIRNNPNLSMCHTPCICAHLLNEGNIDIELNMMACNSREEIIAECLASAVRHETTTSLRILPNPVPDILSIKEMVGEGFFKIYSITGQPLQTGHTYNHQVDVRHLPTGLYLMQVISANTLLVGKFNKV
jgi:hypothetical protein